MFVALPPGRSGRGGGSKGAPGPAPTTRKRPLSSRGLPPNPAFEKVGKQSVAKAGPFAASPAQAKARASVQSERPTAGAGEDLPLGRVFVSSVVVISVLVAVMAGMSYLFGPALARLGKSFVDVLGGPGIALGYLVPDALTVPIPADVVASFGLFGGMSFASVVAWGSLGSLVGGSIGWAIGHFGAWRIRSLQARIDGDDKVVPFLRRRGTAVLAIAALTPLPYSIACWGVGALRMPFGTFILVSLLRIPRVGLYLYLVQQGVLSVGGLEGVL